MPREIDPHCWLTADTLESVTEVNEQVLALLIAQARCGGQDPLLRTIGAALLALDDAALRRAAQGAVLLVDAGLGDTRVWADAIAGAVHDRPTPRVAPFFTVEGSVELMRLLITQVWHLARSEPAAARLLMGLSAANVELIGGCTLRRVTDLALGRVACLRPRWEGRPRVWSDLLNTVVVGESAAMQSMRARGLQLLAADARLAVL